MNWFSIASGMLAAIGPLALPTPPPNIVVILMDDMRWDEVQFMPLLASRAAEAGIVFENAFVSTPLCCPARASLLTGLYAKNHRVLNNDTPNGSVWEFDDSDTLATRLQTAGYRTGLIGKYMNRYPQWANQHQGQEIPPGWSTFAGWTNAADWNDWNLWVGSSTSSGRADGEKIELASYAMDELGERSRAFAGGSEPFFLYFAPFAPHKPATPDPQDNDLYESYEYRIRGYGESAIEDKPLYVQTAAAAWQGDDALTRDRLRCLASADRAVDSLLDSLPANTVIVFISDNGFMLGEHRLTEKGVPYEEAIRVPLIVFAPGFGPDTRTAQVDAVIDTYCAILSWAGVTAPTGRDCISLRPIYESNSDGRDYIYSQSWPVESIGAPGWALIRAGDLKYVSLDTDEEEFYDLTADPYELENAIANEAYADFLPWFRSEAASMRGLSIKTLTIPIATVGVAYSVTLTAWGGTGSHTWSKILGNLPAGLSLSSGGVISGTPMTAQVRTFTIKAIDANGQRESREFTLEVTQ